MSGEQLLVHIDPAIGSTNLGDEIISEAVSSNLKLIFPSARIVSMGSRNFGKWSKNIIKTADIVFFGGSNALSSNPVFGYRQFAMGFLEYLCLSNVVLLGVGWWQYQDRFGPFARTLYKGVLRKDIIHSVRDEYTLKKMHEVGFKNVLNTSCPTMWGLAEFETTVTDSVVITLTDYNRNYKRDLVILKGALEKFSSVYFWPQGTNDAQYLQTFSSFLNIKKIHVLKPSLNALDELLNYRPCYVGTRLHAGIRALQHQCASYVVPIDNRAIEIAKTESLPLVCAELNAIESGAIYHFVNTKKPEVQEFINQFR
ncbi:MAG: polysaccharide pyruvyl transferase family protein [Flavisolibacter sp.]